MKQTNRRGLSTMRTHINRRLPVSRQPHEIYMKLTALEIERSRRHTERDAMNKRLRLLEERLGEIEAEQAELNGLLEKREHASAVIGASFRSASEVEKGQFRY